jgi:hypothetical protein
MENGGLFLSWVVQSSPDIPFVLESVDLSILLLGSWCHQICFLLCHSGMFMLDYCGLALPWSPRAGSTSVYLMLIILVQAHMMSRQLTTSVCLMMIVLVQADMMSRQLVYDGAVFLQSVVVMKAGDQF